MFTNIIGFPKGTTEEEIVEKLYKIFRKDFVENETYLDETIYVNPREHLKKDDKEEDFWHIITRENKKNKTREVDLDRGARLHWIKPIIENYEIEKIKLFYYLENSRKIRLYLWLEENDFVVILQKLGNTETYLVTCFYIDQKYKRETYEKRYLDYKNKKNPALQGCEWF